MNNPAVRQENGRLQGAGFDLALPYLLLAPAVLTGMACAPV
jgi:hypothetical protein